MDVLIVDFCGEEYKVIPGVPFDIGRVGDLSVDPSNYYLHRRFLSVEFQAGLWWITNVGSHLSASVSAADSGFTATLPPAAKMPLPFGESVVVFSAGPTTYELILHSGIPLSPPEALAQNTGTITIGVPALTDSQKVLIVVLAEEILRRDGTGASSIPSSAQAAARLGWSLTKFNRKLDNVCDKLDMIGISGMRAGGGRLANNRRVKLVEYAISSGLVKRSDLPMIDHEAQRNAEGAPNSPQSPK